MIKKGSITVYLTLVMLLIFAILFTLLEGVRYQGQRVNAEIISMAAADSVFAEYNRQLLERYEIFALDGAYSGSGFDIEAVNYRLGNNARANSGSGLFAFPDIITSIPAYRLLTDDEGEPYVKMACEYMKGKLAVEALKKAVSICGDIDEEDLSLSSALKNIEKGDGALSDDSYKSEEECVAVTEEEKEMAGCVPAEDMGILKKVLEIKRQGVLGLVIDDASDISSKAADLSRAVSKRSLRKGTHNEDSGINAGDDLIFTAYLGDKFGYYGHEREGSALDYEIEYICEGRNTDRANLEKVAETLVALREAVNLAKDIKDSQKMQRARIVAIAIAGIFVVPELIGIIQMAVITAWAFMESIDDVKALFAGKKLSDFESGNIQLGYKEYLEMILFIKSRKTRVYRSLDIMEINIRQEEWYGNFAADNMIVGIDWKAGFTTGRVFAGLLGTVSFFARSYTIEKEGYYTYE